MNLSQHFTLDEFTVTQIRAFKNDPPETIIFVLRNTAGRMERIRELLGHPIIITSGYRSEAVNSAVGGSKNSAHIDGRAADFICPKFGNPLAICRAIAESDIQFDQLIEEGTWVHISFAPMMRRQVLTRVGKAYVTGLRKEKIA